MGAVSTIGFGFNGGSSNGGGGGGNNFATQTFSIGNGLILGGNTFVLSNIPKSIQMLFLNGSTTTTAQWSLAGTTITMLLGFTFQADTIIQVQYQY